MNFDATDANEVLVEVFDEPVNVVRVSVNNVCLLYLREIGNLTVEDNRLGVEGL